MIVAWSTGDRPIAHGVTARRRAFRLWGSRDFIIEGLFVGTTVYTISIIRHLTHGKISPSIEARTNDLPSQTHSRPSSHPQLTQPLLYCCILIRSHRPACSSGRVGLRRGQSQTWVKSFKHVSRQAARNLCTLSDLI